METYPSINATKLQQCQYGGFCAFAASKNSLADTDPKAWTIHNKKLYLNYSLSVRNLWLKDKNTLILEANKHWPTLMKTVPDTKQVTF